MFHRFTGKQDRLSGAGAMPWFPHRPRLAENRLEAPRPVGEPGPDGRQPDPIASAWRAIAARRVAAAMLEKPIVQGSASTLRSRDDMVEGRIVGMVSFEVFRAWKMLSATRAYVVLRPSQGTPLRPGLI